MPLIARQLAYAYTPGRPVLRAVDAAFAPGRVSAIIGANGSGKSTLLRLLLGLHAPGGGEVTLAGEPVLALSPARRASRMAYVPQRSDVAFSFTARAVVGFGLVAGPARPRDADRALAALGVDAVADQPFPTLSAGVQQRVTLARALAQLGLPGARDASHPRALVLDEPVAAMDPAHALASLRLLQQVARDGAIVVVVLHDLSLAARFCDDALAISRDGPVLAAGPAREVLQPATLERAYGAPFDAVNDPADPSRTLAIVPR